jgi:hypothetical protein
VSGGSGRDSGTVSGRWLEYGERHVIERAHSERYRSQRYSHCTRDGQYSLYSNGIQDENFLRGVQVTDGNGQVTFQTIYPGCYSGRYPHIHFEVYPSLALATLYTNKILTSQMALPKDVSSAVYSGASGYSASVSNLAGVTTSSDNVFGDNTAAQIALMTPSISGDATSGFTGTITIGVPA